VALQDQETLPSVLVEAVERVSSGEVALPPVADQVAELTQETTARVQEVEVAGHQLTEAELMPSEVRVVPEL
jgi:DNA-binding NarL/FixJ family response regulator